MASTIASLPIVPRPDVERRAPAVEVKGVSYRYGDRRALAGLSLTVPAGAIVGLLGPNGSGKSTLLSLLIGRRRPDKGDIRILGNALTPALRASLGIVFQEPSLDPQMTVRETLELHGRLFGMPRTHRRSRIDAMLTRLDLTERAASFVSTLSGGMKRRLELARALLTDPEVILLDEPTIALDPDSRQVLWQHLLEANAQGRTLLIATNDVREAERYCGTVALLDAGRIVAEGSPAQLKRGLRRDAVRVEWKTDPAGELPLLHDAAGDEHVRVAGRLTHVTVDDAGRFLARLFQSCGDRVHSVQIEESTLEDVYFQLVGKGIALPAASLSRDEARP